jgi:hypothetical protein
MSPLNMANLRTHNRTKFRFEHQMAPPVIEWLRDDGLSIKCEFSVPWGVCDLVGVKLNQTRVRQRLRYRQNNSVGSPLRLLVLSKIPDQLSGKAITLNRLRQDCAGWLTNDLVENEVKRLIDLRFVTSPRRGQYQKLNGWAPLHLRIVAVELKLSRISEALVQASSNRAFATESYVALPFDLALRLTESRRLEGFTQTGVGLLAVSSNSCKCLLRCRRVNEHGDELLQAHCVERFWRTRENSP